MHIFIRFTGQFMHESELRAYLKANGGPSYDILTEEVMEAIGVDPVLEGPQATGGSVYQHSQLAGFELVGNKWYTRYALGPVFTDEKQEAEYRQRKDAERAQMVRAERAGKLSDCDWTQIADATVDKAAWAKYRQALRDITKQEGFPWTIVWPEHP